MDVSPLKPEFWSEHGVIIIIMCVFLLSVKSRSWHSVCMTLHSANILLDDDLQPKLSDFGLARLRPHSNNQHCTITLDTSYHSNLGYLPEEYIRDGKLSFSLDVYSFGMVIITKSYTIS